MARAIPIETETVEEYPGNVSIERKKTDDGEGKYLVTTPVEHSDDYRGTYAQPIPSFRNIDLAELYVDLHHATGGFNEIDVGDSGVPPRVAADGSEALVAYLVCQGGVDWDWIEQELDIQRRTISSYLSRLRSRAEEAREELEE